MTADDRRRDWVDGLGRELREQWNDEYIEAVIRRRYAEHMQQDKLTGEDAAQRGVRKALDELEERYTLASTREEFEHVLIVHVRAAYAAHAAATEARHDCWEGVAKQLRPLGLATETPPNVSSDEREPECDVAAISIVRQLLFNMANDPDLGVEPGEVAALQDVLAAACTYFNQVQPKPDEASEGAAFVERGHFEPCLGCPSCREHWQCGDITCRLCIRKFKPVAEILTETRERKANCLRLAEKKDGEDREGWCVDADYFHTVEHLLRTPSPEPVQAGGMREVQGLREVYELRVSEHEEALRELVAANEKDGALRDAVTKAVRRLRSCSWAVGNEVFVIADDLERALSADGGRGDG